MASTNTDPDPKKVTIRGRLSFPRFTHAEAVQSARKSSIAQIKANASNSPAEISSEFNLLVEQDQLDKLKAHILDVFLPYAEAQHRAGEKRDSLEPKIVAKIKAMIDSEEWDDTPPTLLIKKISEKNAESAPEAVASIKISGVKGGDVSLKASVFNESQLAVPDGDVLTYPTVKPINETVFQMYPGAYVGATLNLYAFAVSNAVNGISGGANAAVYLGNLEGERFGGGFEIDEDEIFMD
jgi:hypothetical protein